MRVETRSSLILLSTLALGIALGVVGGGRWRQLRAESARELRRPAGFVNHMLDIIEPRDNQRDQVRAVLDSTARRNEAILSAAQQSLKDELDAMRKRLAPQLDDAQRARLADDSNFGDPLRPPPPGGPPPGGGPPRGGPPPAGPPPGGPPPGGPPPGGPPPGGPPPGGPPPGGPPPGGPPPGGQSPGDR